MSKDGEAAKEKRGMFARLFGRGASAPTSESPPDGAAGPPAPPDPAGRPLTKALQLGLGRASHQ